MEKRDRGDSYLSPFFFMAMVFPCVDSGSDGLFLTGRSAEGIWLDPRELDLLISSYLTIVTRHSKDSYVHIAFCG